MAPTKRFIARRSDIWALVPGPNRLSGRINADSVREVVEYKVLDVEQHIRKFDGLKVTHDANPDHESWCATIKTADGILSTKMTLMDQSTFGGLGVWGDCDRQLLLDFWWHLQSEFPAVWLFGCLLPTFISMTRMRRLQDHLDNHLVNHCDAN